MRISLVMSARLKSTFPQQTHHITVAHLSEHYWTLSKSNARKVLIHVLCIRQWGSHCQCISGALTIERCHYPSLRHIFVLFLQDLIIFTKNAGQFIQVSSSSALLRISDTEPRRLPRSKAWKHHGLIRGSNRACWFHGFSAWKSDGFQDWFDGTTSVSVP